MSNTITNEQIEERCRQIDAKEDTYGPSLAGIGARAIRGLVTELGALKTENEEMRAFLLSLGFEDFEWNSEFRAQNSEAIKLGFGIPQNPHVK